MVSKSHAFFPVIFTQFIKYKQFFVQHPSIKNSVHQLFFIFWGGRKLDEYFFLGRLLYISTSEWVLHTLFTDKNMCFLCFSNFKLHFEKEREIRQKWKKCYSQILVRTSIEKIGYNFCISNLEK